MKPSMLLAASCAGALALLMLYLASPRQRLLRAPLPAFPSRVTAVMAAIVALKALTEFY